jgi:flagellar hook-associated protein 1 FlgK
MSINAINRALTGLQAHQASLEVAGQNVANVNTKGYHRQEAVLRSTATTTTGGLAFGQGVEVTTIRRMQAAYVSQQLNGADSQASYWSTMHGTLQQVEATLAPTTDGTLSALLDTFFTRWSSLASQPDDATRRGQVTAAAQELTRALNDAAGGLTQIDANLTTALKDDVTRINDLADRIAVLNGQIGAQQATGQVAGDLYDQRANALNALSQLTGATSLSNETGVVIVNVGGRTLVQGTSAHHLAAAAGGSGLTWDDGTAVRAGGETGALLDLHATTLPAYQSRLDTLAFALASGVNSLHRTGVTADNAAAGDFFTGTTAATLGVAPAILASTNAIAAGRQLNAPGDGSLATAIAALAGQPLIGTQTLNAHAQAMVGQIGTDVQRADTNQAANAALVEQLQAQESAASGVSLDEEMTNMLISQRAYDASARVLTVADEMLRVLIQALG